MDNIICDDFIELDMNQFEMPIITVYKKPKDFPNNFVARIFDLEKPTKYLIAKESYDELIKCIPANMTYMPRFIVDDKNIVCTFI